MDKFSISKGLGINSPNTEFILIKRNDKPYRFIYQYYNTQVVYCEINYIVVGKASIPELSIGFNYGGWMTSNTTLRLNHITDLLGLNYRIHTKQGKIEKWFLPYLGNQEFKKEVINNCRFVDIIFRNNDEVNKIFNFKAFKFEKARKYHELSDYDNYRLLGIGA